ncbi:hypothetical protein FNV43_RR04590 [Rhamnella rubrinervis]|uniref:Transposase (putative) gypsy type domain-containing protein n=1 Tax=Rhamnella rubrinervis TaxID=2594499 RepID=A0A8K0HLB6_9ROSA|nr:hypothetical protein FNV43_RR04590 [Rhamnella rubrinervis]
MPYLKKRYGFPENVILSAPADGERADSVRDGWICFYEIAFKLGLKLPFHHIISMVLKYFNLAPGQLMPNGWRYLLGLIVLSEQLGQHIDMSIFLHFFYLKSGREGRYAFYARKQTKLLTVHQRAIKAGRTDTSSSKRGSIRSRPNSLSICAALNQSAKLSTNAEQNNSINVLRATGKNLNLLLSAKSFRVVGILKSMPLEDICHEAKQGALKERDEWHQARPQKEKIVYRKGVEDAYLRAQKEMILKFKAGQTSWPTPEPSEDEGEDEETSEISSNESEPEHVGQQEDPLAVQEGCSSPTRDSFIETMEASRTDTPEPNSNMEEVVCTSTEPRRPSMNL